MTSYKTLHYSKDAWKLLKGLCPVYKPPNFPLGTLKHSMKRNLVRDLNEMKRAPLDSSKFALETGISDLIPTNIPIYDDPYASNPLVLGPGYSKEDIQIDFVRELSYRESGVTLVVINDPELTKNLKKSHYLDYVKVEIFFGKLTDTGFVNGKTLRKSSYKFVNLYSIQKALASIQTTHQKLIFQQSNLNPHSQEAYETLAKNGMILPRENYEGSLIYKISCSEYKVGFVTLDITIYNPSESFFTDFVTEFGRLVRSEASIVKIRCAKSGYFDARDSLLFKYTDLQKVLETIETTRQILINNNEYPNPS